MAANQRCSQLKGKSCFPSELKAPHADSGLINPDESPLKGGHPPINQPVRVSYFGVNGVSPVRRSWHSRIGNGRVERRSFQGFGHDLPGAVHEALQRQRPRRPRLPIRGSRFANGQAPKGGQAFSASFGPVCGSIFVWGGQRQTKEPCRTTNLLLQTNHSSRITGEIEKQKLPSVQKVL